MKRIVTLLLAAGLVLGASVGSSKAADVKVSGNWQFGFEWSDQSFKDEDSSDTFTAVQRLRTKIDIITSENLRGVVFFEIGNTHWGKNSDGAALGSDGKTVKVRYSYVDWVVPNTELKVRMGLQPWLLPNFTKGSAVLDSDGAGITMSYQFNDMVGVTLGWLRAENDNTAKQKSDALDLFMLSVPVTGDGFKVTPWGMYGVVGKNSLLNSGSDINDLRFGLTPMLTADMASGIISTDRKRHGSAWWLGLGGELTMFAPFRLAADFAYGSVDMGNAKMLEVLNPMKIKNMDMKRRGWYASLLAQYKLDMVTPGLYFWYASGDNSNPYDGSERMPSANASWAGTMYGYAGSDYYSDSIMSDSPAGTWGVALMLDNISFMEDLTHSFEVAYIRGTNNKNMPRNAGMASPYHQYMDEEGYVGNLYMTTKDSAWEIDFTTKYNIYKDLYLMLELAYIRLDLDKNVWGVTAFDKHDKNAYKAAMYMKYSF